MTDYQFKLYDEHFAALMAYSQLHGAVQREARMGLDARKPPLEALQAIADLITGIEAEIAAIREAADRDRAEREAAERRTVERHWGQPVTCDCKRRGVECACWSDLLIDAPATGGPLWPDDIQP